MTALRIKKRNQSIGKGTHCRLLKWRCSLPLCNSTGTWCCPSAPSTAWSAAVDYSCCWTWLRCTIFRGYNEIKTTNLKSPPTDEIFVDIFNCRLFRRITVRALPNIAKCYSRYSLAPSTRAHTVEIPKECRKTWLAHWQYFVVFNYNRMRIHCETLFITTYVTFTHTCRCRCYKTGCLILVLTTKTTTSCTWCLGCWKTPYERNAGFSVLCVRLDRYLFDCEQQWHNI